MREIIIRNGLVTKNTISNNISLDDKTLTIPNKTVIDLPIKITLDNLDIVVGDNCDVKIILEVVDQTNKDVKYDINLVTGKNSHIKYLLLAALNSSDALMNHKFIVNRDTNLDILTGFVSNVVKADLNVAIEGVGANVDIKSVAVASSSHKHHIDIYLHHKAPNTHGNMTSVGIANSDGHIILNGIEKIEKDMKNSNVYQTLRGIITSDDATIEINPILLIDEYDIAAGHAATVGKIEEDQLYYLQSRGLKKADAERLIINGFLNPLLDQIDDEDLKERFRGLINARI